MLTEPKPADRITDRVRWIAARGIAAVVAGILVLGVGGRLVMLASRLLHPDAVGRLTENGNRIGEFTIDGTIGLMIFGGLLGGLFAGVVWVVVYEWIPRHWALVGAGSVAIGGLFLIEADNRDFRILDPPSIDVLLLLGLVFVFGAVIVRLDRWLDGRLPPARSLRAIVVYVVLVGLGAPIVLPTFGGFLSKEFCFCETPPVWTGLFLLSAALVSLTAWIIDLQPQARRPDWLSTAGRLASLGAITTAAIHLAGQVSAIL